MLDLKVIRENPKIIRKMLENRNAVFHLDDLLKKDTQRRALITEIQSFKHKKNVVSSQISQSKKNKDEISDKILKMRELSKTTIDLESKVKALDAEVFEIAKKLPNIPHDSVPVGLDESDNIVVRCWGEASSSGQFQDHIDLALKLDLIDLDRAAKVSGSRFYYLKNDLVKLNYALISFALDFIQKKDFTLVQPPYLLRRKAIEGSIIFSDFEDVIYKIEDQDIYLIGTSEHSVAAMHMGEILHGSDLPLRYAGISPCFRKEAGAHGRDTKGIFRVHQFEKVEQFVFTTPEDSWKEHEILIKNAEEIYQQLEIPYRVMLLCTGDLGNVSAKTYDLEAWFPGQNSFREVVSCSNCTDYQARSLGVKYRNKPHEGSQFVHTLNSTLIATERTLIAILENNQQSDGSILIPKVLIPYMAGHDLIKPKKGIA